MRAARGLLFRPLLLLLRFLRLVLVLSRPVRLALIIDDAKVPEHKVGYEYLLAKRSSWVG